MLETIWDMKVKEKQSANLLNNLHAVKEYVSSNISLKINTQYK